MGKGFTSALKASRDAAKRGEGIVGMSHAVRDTLQNVGKPTVPRMAGEVKSPSEGEEYRSVGDFRNFR
tara:strand:- start:950 stop:1153 length:204 start_codon:yes stop_codon:yes gene_type:complete